jgi:hypothetical protein
MTARRRPHTYVLWGGGLGQSLLGAVDSIALESVGDPGPGKRMMIYASAGHVYIEVAGIYLDTAAGLGNPPSPPPTGPLEHRRHRTGGVLHAAFARALTCTAPSRPSGAITLSRYDGIPGAERRSDVEPVVRVVGRQMLLVGRSTGSAAPSPQSARSRWRDCDNRYRHRRRFAPGRLPWNSGHARSGS